MEIGSSIVKSTYSMAKSTGKYVKSYVVNPIDDTQNKSKISWTSFIILFKNPKGGLILDKAYIFIGNIPEHFHAYYINFINWSINGTNLVYNDQIYDPKTKTVLVGPTIINPQDVHLHCRIGDTIFDMDYFKENPIYYAHFFSNPQNKIYLAIKDQLVLEKVSVINFTDSCSLLCPISVKNRSKRICDPRFFTDKHQIYGKDMDHVMFTGIIPEML